MYPYQQYPGVCRMLLMSCIQGCNPLYCGRKEQLQKTMSTESRKYFGKKCVCITDCFEKFIDRPSRSQAWSSYKHHNTVKFLIGLTSKGSVSYTSKACGGRTSYKYITEHCGFLNYIIPGDLILADRGFETHVVV